MRTPDFYVIRVSVSSPCKETEGINVYKSIMINNHEKTPQVIRNAMLKHALEGNPDDFALAQLLPKSGNLDPFTRADASFFNTFDEWWMMNDEWWMNCNVFSGDGAAD